MQVPISPSSLTQLKEQLCGRLLVPIDAEYDACRGVWNATFNRRPGAIARCRGVADVVAAVNFARDQNVILSVRSGGHSLSGQSTNDGGLVIDLSPMKGMRVDPDARRAHAQAGLTWGEFDREAQVYGLATPGGLISSTGIAGLTLGGGIGRLTRKHGLSCDNLVSADVVAADGRVLRASATEHPELFWALRGGGGNFGIVTSFEYKMYPCTTVYGGPIVFTMDKARDVLRACRDAIGAGPEEFSYVANLLTAKDLKIGPPQYWGVPKVAVSVCFTGSKEEGDRVMDPLRRIGALADELGPMPYTRLQNMFDVGAPYGICAYGKSHYLGKLPDEAIDRLISYMATATAPNTQVLVSNNNGGVAARVGEDETAFSNRQAPYFLDILAMWKDGPSHLPEHAAWAKELWTMMKPYSTGGVYVNFMTDDNVQSLEDAYGAAKVERLRAVKRQYNPANLFRLNVNIAPSQGA